MKCPNLISLHSINDQKCTGEIIMCKVPELHTDQIILTILSPDDYPLLLNYYINNQKHLSLWEPGRSESYYTIEDKKERITYAKENLLMV